jgi:pimeloyl-ACP methyl ester carboxylesterase
VTGIDYDIAGATSRRFRARDGLMLQALEWPGDPARMPLLCLPGISRTALDFVALAARQRGARRVVALDHAGHGASARPAQLSRYGVLPALRDVTDTLAALHLDRVALLGTSFGGILAMGLGVMRPMALGAVMLNDVGPRMTPRGLDVVQDMIGRDPALATEAEAVAFCQARMGPMRLDEAGWLRMAARTYARGADGRLHPRWDTRIVQLFARESAGVSDLWGAFGALAHARLLLIWGLESDLLSGATVAAMQAARPDMGVVAVPGVGHSPTLEEPEAIRGVQDFLDRLP